MFKKTKALIKTGFYSSFALFAVRGVALVSGNSGNSGNSSDSTKNSLTGLPGIDLTIQSLFGIIEGLACWASRFVIVFIVIMLIWYGIQFMTAQANTEAFNNAKKALNYAIIGIIVVLGANTIIATVAHAIDSNSSYSVFALDCSAR